jgi:hypothetical protein
MSVGIEFSISSKVEQLAGSVVGSGRKSITVGEESRIRYVPRLN